MTKNTQGKSEAKAKVKRPRAGTWTKISKQVPIPGTESDTADLDMYRVEYRGEVLEVQRNRAGVARANAWIRGLRSQAEQTARIDRVRRQLVDLAGEATGDLAERLNQAAALLD